jgi:ankyrin repeat protein
MGKIEFECYYKECVKESSEVCFTRTVACLLANAKEHYINFIITDKNIKKIKNITLSEVTALNSYKYKDNSHLKKIIDLDKKYDKKDIRNPDFICRVLIYLTESTKEFKAYARLDLYYKFYIKSMIYIKNSIVSKKNKYSYDHNTAIEDINSIFSYHYSGIDIDTKIGLIIYMIDINNNVPDKYNVDGQMKLDIKELSGYPLPSKYGSYGSPIVYDVIYYYGEKLRTSDDKETYNLTLLYNYCKKIIEKANSLQYINIVDKSNNIITTPLLYMSDEEWISTKHDNDIVKLLLEKGVDPLIKNSNGNTALHILLSKFDTSKLGIVDLLWNSERIKDNLYVLNNNGNTALHCLLLEHKKEKKKLNDELEKKKYKKRYSADIEYLTDKLNNNVEYLFYIINKLDKTTVDVKDSAGNNLLDLAFNKTLRSDIIVKLFELGSTLSEKLKKTVLQDFIPKIKMYNNNTRVNDIIIMLIKHGVDIPTYVDSDGNTLLQSYMIHSNVHDPNIIEKFLDSGIDVNNKNKYSETALFYINERDNFASIVDMLVKRGADMHIKNNDGKTADEKMTDRVAEYIKTLMSQPKNLHNLLKNNYTTTQLTNLQRSIGVSSTMELAGALSRFLEINRLVIK